MFKQYFFLIICLVHLVGNGQGQVVWGPIITTTPSTNSTTTTTTTKPTTTTSTTTTTTPSSTTTTLSTTTTCSTTSLSPSTSTTTTSTTTTISPSTSSTSTTTPTPPTSNQTSTSIFDAFISYRRAPSRALAMLLKVLLEQHQIHSFLDVEDLRAGPWHSQLMSGIANSTSFIFILSNTTLDRTIGDVNYVDVVHQEIRQAVNLGKHIIPVFDEYNFPPITQFSPEVQEIFKYQGVVWEHAYTLDSLDRLIAYLKTPSSSPKNGAGPIAAPPLFRNLMQAERIRNGNGNVIRKIRMTNRQ